jgi:hypothetical protein
MLVRRIGGVLLVILCFWSGIACSYEKGVSDLNIQIDTARLDEIGFFTPNGLEPSRFFSDFSVIPVYPVEKNGTYVPNIDQLKSFFAAVRGTDHTIYLNITALVAQRKSIEHVDMTYLFEKQEYEKRFHPLEHRKVFTLISNQELKSRLSPLIDLIKKYKKNTGNIVVFDEPYINCVSRETLERGLRVLRSCLYEAHLDSIKLQVNFAGAMFNAHFAKHIDEQLGRYVFYIDQHYKNNEHLIEKHDKQAVQFRNWLDKMNHSRLVSYDQAGNVYTKGGLPQGIDVVSFDFYASSVLFDEMYDQIVTWFTERDLTGECQDLGGRSIDSLCEELSFFADGPVSPNIQKDNQILDHLFECRMESGLKLLKAEFEKSGPKEVMMVAEASTNGFFEFDEDGTIESEQPYKLVESRVLSEFKRYLRFYTQHPEVYDGGILIFLYPNTYDASINLDIFGVEGMPSVKEYIQKLYNE